MFKFDGRIDRAAFLRAAVLRIGLFIASVIGFPFLLWGLANLTNCAGIGGACGALGLVAATAFKPFAFSLFLFSFVGISMCRARDLGMPAVAGLVIPALFAGDHEFLIYGGAPWSFAFSAGVLHQPFPGLALLALVCAAIFSAAPADSFGPTTPEVVTTSTMQGPGPTNVAYDPAPFPPIARLIVVAFIIALGASAVVFSRQFSLNWQIFLLTSLGTVVFPTTALYFFPLLGLWLTAKRRTAGSLVMLVLSLVPFGHWGYSHWSAFQAHRQETAQIASVPTQAAPRVPVTLVVESSSVTGVRAAFTVPQIDHAISKGPFGRELAQFERPQFPSRDSKKLQVTALPEEYLLLRVGRSSGFATPKQPYAADGGPLELRYIDSSHDDLIAVWYRSFNPAPSTLPVITTFGWFRGDNSATTDEIEDRVAKFLRTALDREAGRRS